MKIAALSDIHGNVYALRAIPADARGRGADTFINLGNILYGPLAPRATYDLLMQHRFATIRGNQDRQIYEADAEELSSNPTLQFVRDDLGAQPIAWLESLPFDLLFEDIYLCHGTPDDDLTYLLEEVDGGHAKVRPDDAILRLLDGQTSRLILCGHTHTPRTVLLSSGHMVVNPGSVGLPAYADDQPIKHVMETHSPHASYALLERTASGWTVAHIRVAYDHHAAAREAAKRRREDWAYALSTGRVPSS